MDREKISSFESFWYILFCVLTLGQPFLWKIIVKKALIETNIK